MHQIMRFLVALLPPQAQWELALGLYISVGSLGENACGAFVTIRLRWRLSYLLIVVPDTGKNKNPQKGILIFGGPGRTVNSHVRLHSMGPFHYVRFKRRIRLFSPTDVPNRSVRARHRQK